MPELAARTVEIPSGGATLPADLAGPKDPSGLVVFAHGSGSSRKSPRNRQVAAHLHGSGLATLLMDLLTEREEEEERLTRHHRFDIGLLAERLVGATRWARAAPDLAALPVGYFGASTGAAAALVAASTLGDEVSAVVSRGGRPDLAGEALSRVRAPTLLVVGGADQPVVEMNEWARDRMPGEVSLEIVPGATHLFPEPGALERVAELAAGWFTRHLLPTSG